MSFESSFKNGKERRLSNFDKWKDSTTSKCSLPRPLPLLSDCYSSIVIMPIPVLLYHAVTNG